MDELLDQLIAYAGDDYEKTQFTLLETILEDALEEVVNTMYPFGYDEKDAEKNRNAALKRYKSVIRRIAEFHYDKQGKEGVSSFTENGVSHNYESSGTPTSYLRGIVPLCKIV